MGQTGHKGAAMLRRLIDRFWPTPIRDSPALSRWISGEASYLAQRSTYEFTRNTLAWFGQHHFADDRFNDHFRICRWESFAALLQGMTLLAEFRLRPHARGAEQHLVDGLVAAFAQALAEYPLPQHRPQGWDDAAAEARARLLEAQARSASPDAKALAHAATERMIQVMPVLSANRADDFRTIESAIQFGLVAFADRVPRRIDAPALAASLRGDVTRADAAD